MLPVGTSAPSLVLPDQHGHQLDLAGFQGKRNVVLFFYPKDNTPGCTREACAFRDALSDLEARDAVVIGVSRDDAASHQAFAQRWRLPFSLLTDGDGAVSKLFGVHKTLGLIPGRVTYVIDKRGVVRAAFRDLFDIHGHVRSALNVLEKLDIDHRTS